ncbi:hypothetical protein SAICODRAFT_205922 [Saitoella complicata NRRL Y-17804]|uniref:SP-RING-type domain-containing protein n=1 Tax=Saitoella complicata (strain BCRC 22490 / CBS 7301 / JCM 7358 / NBRC 10748 / NRRL Y-17804) TaxID=698492 RepID=A0A0E9NQ82_SAICN|nr:uncharacterized protein SAICODRAFT_205922 [Saitoella complicata NRRL Y-17804]ODQ54784.1 hypothetical protein SAICODRAFT_205922 [Saitoella complicata NRRL Y-17804]GAO51948.1 hypothetical protein G7K_6036-t1 [Saitoella complicata NRRL Y-17804]
MAPSRRTTQPIVKPDPSSQPRPASASPSRSPEPALEPIPDHFPLDPQTLHKLSNLPNEYHMLTNHLSKAITYVADTAVDCEEVEANSTTAQALDMALRALIDIQAQVERDRTTLQNVHRDFGAGAAADDPIHNTSLSRTFLNRVELSKQNYDEKTSLEKYGENEHYKEFKRRVWDVSHEGETLPRPKRWFADLNDPESESESEDDLVMSHARTSLKCPLTLTLVVDPVTSTVCPHSFSKEAIQDLLRQNGGRCDCPVPGCDKQLTSATLKADRVLERRVREAREREEEGVDAEMLDSSDAEDEGYMKIE